MTCFAIPRFDWFFEFETLYNLNCVVKNIVDFRCPSNLKIGRFGGLKSKEKHDFPGLRSIP